MRGEAQKALQNTDNIDENAESEVTVLAARVKFLTDGVVINVSMSIAPSHPLAMTQAQLKKVDGQHKKAVEQLNDLLGDATEEVKEHLHSQI